METRRLLIFMIVSTTFILVWSNYVADKLPKPPAPPQQQAQPDAPADVLPVAEANADPDEGNAVVPAEVAVPQEYEHRTIVLGSSDPQSDYALMAEFTTTGAAIDGVWLAGTRLKDLDDRSQQVQVLGNNHTDYRTFSTTIDLIDAQLKPHGTSLALLDWNVKNAQQDSVSFSYLAPDGSVEVSKTYRIQPLTATEVPNETARKQDPQAYTIRCELAVRNLTAVRQEFRYEILGPTGIILENAEHTRKYRDVKLEFLEGDGYDSIGAAELQGEYDDLRTSRPGVSDSNVEDVIRESEHSWSEPFRYAGVDVQFFAALLAPLDHRPLPERLKERWIEKAWPVLVEESPREENLSDMSFRLLSTPQVLSPAGTPNHVLKHEFALFVGPKRDTLLDPPPFQAERVLDYGSWFGFIARGMHSVLNFLYNLGLPYWLAIISLTAMVRGCLFPLSRKQALSAARMKELQPKINELKLKYGDDKEKMAKAQMDLWRKHKINPLGGCLPLFFQFPVFIGLYTCLNTAVDLRLSSFLWIDNLAAPDALFRMPFSLPFLGYDFNLLPCINVVLFLVQQKMFMPPPADEQAEMQQKMMNYMTIVFAVMFWHVPAGLCIYFVASSLWSIAERKLLGSNVLGSSAVDDAGDAEESTASDSPSKPGKKANRNPEPKKKNDPDKPKGFFGKLMDAAEQAKQQAEKSKGGGKNKAGRKAGKKGR